MPHVNRLAHTLICSLAICALALPALAGGGNVMPSNAKQKGYSLIDAAAATAVYNTGQMTGNPATPPPPNVPFEVLVADTTVKPGTMIYLPIFVIDDSGGALPGFPADVTDQKAVANFMAAFLKAAFNVDQFIVQVDGQTTALDKSYTVGTKTPPLLDGIPAGTNYTVAAAFLTPLTPGRHIVGVGGMIAGTPVVFVSYTVTVK
jgi:hypothetical protein